MRIGSHRHFWRYDCGDYFWIDEQLSVLQRNYQPKDYMPFIQKHSIKHSVLIQAAETKSETEPTLSRLYPGFHTVIDHGGKPDLHIKSPTFWFRQIEEMAKSPNIFCKFPTC
ncbi:hypothetical protein [Microbulbifer echini]|uniref:hypothetical protein n=1 Tax=Microbulbifer echini TaxID=1529067 RepID=UPI003530D488